LRGKQAKRVWGSTWKFLKFKPNVEILMKLKKRGGKEKKIERGTKEKSLQTNLKNTTCRKEERGDFHG